MTSNAAWEQFAVHLQKQNLKNEKSLAWAFNERAAGADQMFFSSRGPFSLQPLFYLMRTFQSQHIRINT